MPAREKRAMERAIQMLRIASGVLDANNKIIGTTVVYDDVYNDASDIVADCIFAARDLERYIS